jgi:hypothetical protein
MSVSNNNQYNNSDDEDDNNIEHIYNESNDGSNTRPTQPFSFGSSTTNVNNNIPTTRVMFGGSAANVNPFGVGLSFSAKPTSVGMAAPPGAFGLGGCGFRVERHPETGLPIPPVAPVTPVSLPPPFQMGCNQQPPQSACGGIRHNHNQNPILNIQPQSNKHKTIDDLYKKLASARSQIQLLNKVIDEIYETLPKIN